ncbi:MAG: class I SAM-dependent methyltransferase [Oscillospiraceae bacterium]|nr:class I SAM-dependent methyltransferase [Oscillospiraceae bacterium]
MKYLGKTSYYLGLQKKVLKTLKMIKPKSILELGFGTGQTAVKVARANPDYEITAIDLRIDMVDIAQKLAERKKVNNVHFFSDDMIDYVKNDLNRFDIIYLLYSFHHIPDPLIKKTEFLENCYRNMKTDAYLCIAETFLPDFDIDISEFWVMRGEEGYASTWWELFSKSKTEDYSLADEVAAYCQKMELEAGNLVVARKDEYLVKRSWLQKEAEQQGFITLINKPTNGLGDGILLLQK